MKISATVPVEYPHDIYLSNNEEFDKVALLLHGFQLNGKFMFKRFEKKFGPETKVVAPNAPFLVPLEKEGRWEPRYSWYFYDARRKYFHITYDPAAHWLKKLMEKINPEKKETIIIGYSQGGFLAPKAAELLDEASQVVGINCIFRSERFAVKNHVKYSQLHGTQDFVVSPAEAKAEFLTMKEKGAQGEFVETESEHLLNHRLVEEAFKLI